MKSVSVTVFKAHCLEMVNQVALSGQPVILTKRGKPTAMVVPPPADKGPKWVAGKFKDSAKIVGDIVAPLDEPWEALS